MPPYPDVNRGSNPRSQCVERNLRPSFRALAAPAAGVRNTLLGQTLAHPIWMRPGFFVPGPHSKEFPVFDDILDLFSRRKREHDHERARPEPASRLPFLDGDEDEQDEWDRSRQDDERRASRRPSSSRAEREDDWF